MSKTLTPWFPSDVKPFRSGLYELHPKLSWFGKWCWFDAQQNAWSNAGDTKERAMANKGWTNGANQRKSWRGLTKEEK